MFRQMRRIKQQLTQEQAIEILNKNTAGVLALQGDDGYPYAVPLSYAYQDGTIFFHSANNGHKIDAIAQSPKASFCVIDQDQIVPEEVTTDYISVIAFGKIRVISDQDEVHSALVLLGNKYCANHQEAYHAEIEKYGKVVSMFVLEIEHITGKSHRKN